MKKRWLLRLGLLAGLALFGFWFILWWTAPPHRINKRSAELIMLGMTQNEVIAILGVAPGDYKSTTVQFDLSNFEPKEAKRFTRDLNKAIDGNHGHSSRQVWISDSGGILVFFDEKARVCSTAFLLQDDIWDKLRRLLRLS